MKKNHPVLVNGVDHININTTIHRSHKEEKNDRMENRAILQKNDGRK